MAESDSEDEEEEVKEPPLTRNRHNGARTRSEQPPR
jgi:hypothetical protein